MDTQVSFTQVRRLQDYIGQRQHTRPSQWRGWMRWLTRSGSPQGGSPPRPLTESPSWFRTLAGFFNSGRCASKRPLSDREVAVQQLTCGPAAITRQTSVLQAVHQVLEAPAGEGQYPPTPGALTLLLDPHKPYRSLVETLLPRPAAPMTAGETREATAAAVLALALETNVLFSCNRDLAPALYRALVQVDEEQRLAKTLEDPDTMAVWLEHLLGRTDYRSRLSEALAVRIGLDLKGMAAELTGELGEAGMDLQLQPFLGSYRDILAYYRKVDTARLADMSVVDALTSLGVDAPSLAVSLAVLVVADDSFDRTGLQADTPANGLYDRLRSHCPLLCDLVSAAVDGQGDTGSLATTDYAPGRACHTAALHGLRLPEDGPPLQDTLARCTALLYAIGFRLDLPRLLTQLVSQAHKSGSEASDSLLKALADNGVLAPAEQPLGYVCQDHLELRQAETLKSLALSLTQAEHIELLFEALWLSGNQNRPTGIAPEDSDDQETGREPSPPLAQHNDSAREGAVMLELLLPAELQVRARRFRLSCCQPVTLDGGPSPLPAVTEPTTTTRRLPGASSPAASSPPDHPPHALPDTARGTATMKEKSCPEANMPEPGSHARAEPAQATAGEQEEASAGIEAPVPLGTPVPAAVAEAASGHAAGDQADHATETVRNEQTSPVPGASSDRSTRKGGPAGSLPEPGNHLPEPGMSTSASDSSSPPGTVEDAAGSPALLKAVRGETAVPGRETEDSSEPLSPLPATKKTPDQQKKTSTWRALQTSTPAQVARSIAWCIPAATVTAQQQGWPASLRWPGRLCVCHGAAVDLSAAAAVGAGALASVADDAPREHDSASCSCLLLPRNTMRSFLRSS